MKKIEWKRVQVSCVTALMLFMLFAAIKPQLYITEEYTGASVRGYQAAPLAGYLVLSVLICALLIWKGAVNNRRLANAGAVLSLLIMPFISFFIFETVAGNFMTILQNQTSLVFLNLCIWYLLYAVVFAASNCIRFTILTLNTVSYLFAVANAFVVQFREQPIMVMDIKSFLTAVSVAGEFQYDLTVNMVLMGLLALFCNLWILKMDFRFPRFKFRLGYIFLTAGCVGYCLYGMYFGNLFEKAGLTGLDFFRFNLSYKKAGYMACTSLSLKYLQVEEPEGYSAERVKEIQERTDSSDPIQRDLPENIIVIMNESLSDLSVLGDFETSEEMLPYLNSMQENTVRGWAYTSVYGGGTANSEFEFLTGNSVAFIPAGTVAYQMYVEEGDASLTGLLKENGYRTIVYHPYRKDNYNRPAVYQIYGFDEYYAKGDIKHKKLRGYASDASDYKNLIRLYEEKKPGEKWFMFNVTMQNHGGYDSEDFKNTVSLVDYPGQYPQAEQFLSLMQKSDEAFQELIQYFSEVEENTMILMFGDHQPRLEDGFYEKIMGAPTAENYFEQTQKKSVTPYVLWTNYDLDIEQKEYLSLNYLGSYLLSAAGVELPAYNRYLLDLQKKIPAVNANGYLDEHYVMHTFDEEGEYQALLEEYHMLEYNNLFDKRNRIKEFFERE